MPTTENFELPYPNTSDEPNIPKDFQSLATATETALQELKDSVTPSYPFTNIATGGTQYGTAYFWANASGCHLAVRWNSISSGSYDHGVVGQLPDARYYPPTLLESVAAGNDLEAGARRSIQISKTGAITWNNLGGTQTMKAAYAFISW